jgi:hypothetical protein
MASRKKRIAKTKSSRGRAAAKARKIAAKRAPPKKVKKSRSSGKKRVRAAQPKKTRPVVQDTIVDVIDEPVLGIMRVTEIEEVSITNPDNDED